MEIYVVIELERETAGTWARRKEGQSPGLLYSHVTFPGGIPREENKSQKTILILTGLQINMVDSKEAQSPGSKPRPLHLRLKRCAMGTFLCDLLINIGSILLIFDDIEILRKIVFGYRKLTNNGFCHFYSKLSKLYPMLINKAHINVPIAHLLSPK